MTFDADGADMQKRNRYDDDGFFPHSVPIPVAGGIVARTGKGKKFASSWWASRWIAVLESFGWESRLQRGRSYARHGQVLNIDLAPGRVQARVQGSRPRPYSVSIEIRPLDDTAWERVIDSLAERAHFAARLLAGEMPQDIEEVFHAAGVSLFPASAQGLNTHCTCPDSVNPCKHIAAVYYLLGEAFDRDPFFIFRLRGRSQEQIVDALRAHRSAATRDAEPAGQAAPAPAPQPAAADTPLAQCLDRFWSPGEPLDDIEFHIAAPEAPLALLRQLGEPPFWPEGKGEGWYEAMETVYRKVTEAALGVAFGEDGGQ
jgi:uncharacterized Zn finger protein